MSIPRIVHRIWLGDQPMSEEFVEYGETWKAHHPGWEHRLWTEDNLPSDLRRREVFEAFRAPAERSDLLRYELLWRYGGVYVDTDMECLRPIDELVERVDFFAAAHKKGRQLNNSPIGAAAGHPILEAAVRDARAVNYKHPGEDAPRVVPSRSGPSFWHRHVKQFADAHVVPAELFHPATAEERERAYADHHCVNSWMPVEERLERTHAALRKAQRREQKLLVRLRKAEARLEEAREELAVLRARRRAGRAARRRPLRAGALPWILARLRR